MQKCGADAVDTTPSTIQWRGLLPSLDGIPYVPSDLFLLHFQRGVTLGSTGYGYQNDRYRHKAGEEITRA
jgi:hypothetical protein